MGMLRKVEGVCKNDEVKVEWDMHSADDLVVCLVTFMDT